MTCPATVRTPTVLAAAAAAVCLVVAASSCSAEDADGAGGTGGPSLPPSGGIDYQLGGAYEPPAGTTVVVRDASADPVEGVYSVCYLNAFQSQPGTADSWGDLLLRDASGAPVADPDWPDEFLLDTSSAVRRAEIADRLARRSGAARTPDSTRWNSTTSTRPCVQGTRARSGHRG
ncbi:MAG: endo alpha-1,4 polygalactosaminidase [Corynebacterium variabile]|uniref:endo alpha-1,4 polygalactosaminidase n=1 Tax=Corynebacterium variabile TaxID=1727 RepID=UPI003F9396EC